MRVSGLLGILLLVGCSAPRPASSNLWLDAIEASDTETAVGAVRALLETSGADFSSAFGWNLAPYDEPLNHYDTVTGRVTLGRAPTAAQTAAYWQIYSDRLTGGTWRADAFFRDADEARRMASFNQAYLAAHEAGHALAYHYAVNPQWDRVGDERFRTSVHCQELLADRIAAAVLHEVASMDPRAETYRMRYLELMASIDDAIPERQRVRLTSLDTCSETPVLHPQDEATFQRYVSAYFARQRLLLTQSAPAGLAKVLDEHIRWRRAAFVAEVPDLPGTRVTTLPGTLPEPTDFRGDFPSLLALARDLMVQHGEETETEKTGTAYALAVDGEVLVVTSASVMRLDTSSTEAPYANTDLTTRTTLTVDGDEVLLPDLGMSTMLVVQSATALAAEDVLALAAVVDVHEDDEAWQLPDALQLLRIRRAGEVWQAEVGAPFPRTGGSTVLGEAALDDVMLAPDGTVWVESAGHLYSVDLEALVPVGEGQTVNPAWGDLQALDAQGRRLSVRHDVVGSIVPNGGLMSRGDAGALVIRSGPEGAVVLAGTGLRGDRDGPGARAHISRGLAIRAIGETVCLVDWGRVVRVRQIRRLQP